MPALKTDTLPIRASADLVRLRAAVRAWSQELGFNLVEQTKVVTAASELARNTLAHGGGGSVRVEAVEEGGRRGLRLVFEDQGPGIPDIAQAMRDGFSTSNGLGLGLGGAKRLSHDFAIESRLGVGTRVVVTRWK